MQVTSEALTPISLMTFMTRYFLQQHINIHMDNKTNSRDNRCCGLEIRSITGWFLSRLGLEMNAHVRYCWGLFLGDYFPRVGLRPERLELVQASWREPWRQSTWAKIELISACLKSFWRHRTGIPFVSHPFFLVPQNMRSCQSTERAGWNKICESVLLVFFGTVETS